MNLKELKSNFNNNKFQIFIMLLIMYGVYRGIIKGFDLIIIGAVLIIMLLLDSKGGKR